MQERQRMMQEMHDGMGSALIGARRMVEGRGEIDAAEMARVLRECIDDLKLAIGSLTILEPDDLPSLLAMLRFRLEPRLKAAGIELDWHVTDALPPLPWLDAQSALHILRICQEVLTNIVKHTRATRIGFATRAEEGWVQVQVSDDGQGQFSFAPFEGDGPPELPKLAPGKHGLVNVIRRVQAIGGRCAWRATQAGGAFVLSLPVAK